MDFQKSLYKIIGSIQPTIKFKINSYDFGIIPFQSKKVIFYLHNI